MNWLAICTIAGGVGGAAVALIKIKEWWDRRTFERDEKIRLNERMHTTAQINEGFILDVATNHLPHIQTALEIIADHLGVKLPDPPPIRYLPYPDKERT